jgi:hypothetical protein
VISNKTPAKRNKNSVTVSLPSTKSGTAYYITSTDPNANFDAKYIVKNGQILGTISAGTALKTIPVAKNTRVIFVAVIDAAGNISAPFKIIVPAAEQTEFAKTLKRTSRKRKISYSKVSNEKAGTKATFTKEIKNATSSGKPLTKGVDYKISTDERTITLNESWLNMLTLGVHFVQVYFKIGGMATITIYIQK